MKDQPLSLLSRGCARFVSSDKNSRQDGRLDVCFTPQDFFIWRSQDSLLPLSKSGHLLAVAESTLPKTFSTRRGPLLLFSQDFVTVETSQSSVTRDRRQRVCQPHAAEVDQQLSTLRELTAAILNYSNNQFSSSRLLPPLFPSLHIPLAPDLRRSNTSPVCTSTELHSPEMIMQLKQQWSSSLVPAESMRAHQENQPEDGETELGSSKRIRLDLFLQMPCTSRTPSPLMESQPWVHCVATTPEEQQEPQSHTELSPEAGRPTTAEEPQIKREPDMDDCPSTSIYENNSERDQITQEGSKRRKNHGGKDQHRAKQQRETKTSRPSGFLPPITEAHSAPRGFCWKKTENKMIQQRNESPSSDEDHPQRLPPIAESRTGTPNLRVQKKERVRKPESEEHLMNLHQLPLLLPEKVSKKQRRRGEAQRHHLKEEKPGQDRRGRRSERGSLVLLGPGEEVPPPAGALGFVSGHKGPGKQSSLAFFQNKLLDLQDPCEGSDGGRGVVRGLLPLELRDMQNNKPVGCLILGPDGEIIQLSLYDHSQEPTDGDSDTRERALQVLSPEGEKLPWVIMLQPEQTHTGGGLELHTGAPLVDAQIHQSIQKLLDLHRSTEAFSPSSLSVSKNQIKRHVDMDSRHVAADTWMSTKKDAGDHNLRQQGGKKEPQGGDTEEQEELEEKEEFSISGGIRHVSGSPAGGQLHRKPNEEKADNTEDKRRKTKRTEETEESPKTTGKRNFKTRKSAESEGQQALRMKKEGRSRKGKPSSEAQSVRSETEEKKSREAAEQQDRSALPPADQQIEDRGGAQGDLKKNQEREERGGAQRKEEESTRRRRGGKSKHKDLVVGIKDHPKKNEDMINQIIKEEPQPSTRSPSAAENHKNKPNPGEDPAGRAQLATDPEKLSSSIQSMSSIRSAAASQQDLTSSRRSVVSSCEGAGPPSAVGLTSSHGRLSSCSTVMITEEQLMLNPRKPESSRPEKSQKQEEEEAEERRLDQRAEKRRQEVERKRREREEEERRQQEKEQTEERMKSELEEERRRRAEEQRLKKMVEEEKRQKLEDEEQERARRTQEQREREQARQEERRKQMERLQRMREEEERRKKAEQEHRRLDEERRQEEVNKKLQEMDESERMEFLRRKEQEEQDRRREEEEAALQAAEEDKLQKELLHRQVALLQQQLSFRRSLVLEAGGLEKTQTISRPWSFSYFTLLQILGPDHS